jgi:FMN-dependent NADH-azoreductase
MLFRLDASFRSEGSHSRAIADIVEQAWLGANADDQVVRRHLGSDPIPATAWGDAVTSRGVAEDQRTAPQRAAIELAATLADELIHADALLFAVPLFNFGVSQHFKTWVDLVITDPRMGPGQQPLAGKPAELVTVRGGNYSAGTPREGWDHSTPWIRRILEDVWGVQLSVVELDFTLVGVNPALDQFKDVAANLRVEAEALAAQHGSALGQSAPALT